MKNTVSSFFDPMPNKSLYPYCDVLDLDYYCRNEEFYNVLDLYIGKFVDDWGCKIDHEDGSTAPFSSIALQEISQ